MAYLAGDDNATNASKAKIDSDIYQSDGEEGTLFCMPAGWNKLWIDLRYIDVLKFLEYVSII